MRKSDEKKIGQNWFDNAEVKTQKHDQILSWLYKKILSNNETKNFIFKGKYDESRHKVFCEIEYPINVRSKGYNPVKSVKGFVDIRVDLTELNDDHWLTIDSKFIEIKSFLNVGETIRQLKYYATLDDMFGLENWIVCAPPHEDMEIIIEQGLRFIRYLPDNGN